MSTNITNKLAGQAASVTGGVGGQAVRRFYSKTSQSGVQLPAPGMATINERETIYMHASIGITGNVGGATGAGIAESGTEGARNCP